VLRKPKGRLARQWRHGPTSTAAECWVGRTTGRPRYHAGAGDRRDMVAEGAALAGAGAIPGRSGVRASSGWFVGAGGCWAPRQIAFAAWVMFDPGHALLSASVAAVTRASITACPWPRSGLVPRRMRIMVGIGACGGRACGAFLSAMRAKALESVSSGTTPSSFDQDRYVTGSRPKLTLA